MASNDNNSSGERAPGKATNSPLPIDNQTGSPSPRGGNAITNRRRSGDDANTNRRRSGDDRSKIILANPVGFEGDIPEVGAILALKHERFHKKVPFSQFVEKVYGYVLSNFKDVAT